MAIKIGTTDIQNCFIGTTPVKSIWSGTTKVRPTILEYDFTTGTQGWTANGSAISRNSNGFYITGQDVDGYITPPSVVYNKIPKKIQIIYNRPNTRSGTGIYYGNSSNWYFLPRNYYNLGKFDWDYNGKITQNNISLGTGNITWEMDINSSTTNRTITHKITGQSNITDTSGPLKYIWTNNNFAVRLVHWDASGTGPYIKKVIFEY